MLQARGPLLGRGPTPVTLERPSAELSKVTEAGARPKLSALITDLQSLALSIRISSDVGTPEDVRQRIHRLLDKFQREATQHGYRSQEIDDARFAVVALLDETVFNSKWPGREAWRTMSLQQELFKINVAGEEFFTRMDKLRANVKENEQVLEVYFDCLALGFEGRFKLFGREKLDPMVADLSKDLAGGKEWSITRLSPHADRPDDVAEVMGEGVPVWVTTLFFIPGALLLILVFFLLARGTADSTAEAMRDLMRGLGG